MPGNETERVGQTIEDYYTGSGHLNRTTNFAWTLDNKTSTMTAVNATTGDQTTTRAYGTTLASSGVARNDLLASITYPDSGVVSYAYNRLSEQRGTIRSLYRDGLGRQTNDCVTTNGSGTDVSVKQIITAYEVRGMVATVTSTDSASQGAGTVLNQVQLTYNTFAQLTQEEQSHSGAVGSAPSVYYYYDTGASGSNEIRLNQLKYPNSRVLTYNFASGMDATLNPVTSISDTSTTLASYTYLGLGTVVRIAYPQPSVWLDLWGGTSGVFNGLDLFNRIIDQRWQNNTGGTPVDIDRYQYGYSYNSNRLWKANVVGTMNVSAGLDELYQYDNNNRLTKMQRGVLNGGHNGFTGTIAREMDYTLDATGNWPTYLTKTNGTTDLNQGRVSSTVNEITSITESGSTPLWVTPLYDNAGNMTTLPQPATPTSSFTAVYDAWNRMTEIDSGSSPIGQYQYDGRNRRIVSVTTDTRHFYFTNAWQDIEERVGSLTTMNQQHVWGIRYIDELVCRDDPTCGRLYATQDANFNLTAIINTGGTPEEYYFYDPYGAPTILNSSWSVISVSAYNWTIGHQGLIQDPVGGLIYNRRRMLHAPLGGFEKRDLDPAIYHDPNLYEYEGGNPISRLDPLGLNWYGNYCGPGGAGVPIDALDARCQTHDACYGKCGAAGVGGFLKPGNPAARVCDGALCLCAKGVACKNAKCSTARLAIMGAMCVRGNLP